MPSEAANLLLSKSISAAPRSIKACDRVAGPVRLAGSTSSPARPPNTPQSPRPGARSVQPSRAKLLGKAFRPPETRTRGDQATGGMKEVEGSTARNAVHENNGSPSSPKNQGLLLDEGLIEHAS